MKKLHSLGYYSTRKILNYTDHLQLYCEVSEIRDYNKLGHTARMGETRDAYRILVWISLRKWPL